MDDRGRNAAARRRRPWACLAAALVLAGAGIASAGEPRSPSLDERRLLMVRQIAASLREDEAEAGPLDIDPRVLSTIAKTPRHEFVPPPLVPFAYEDRALRIGPDQSLTQPSVAAVIAELAAPTRDDRVLLIGVSGGYDAAILAQLAYRVHILDMSPATLHAATARLLRLGYTNFEGRTGDGYYGWPEPGLRFDAIVVRWSLDHVPTTLLRQLKPGGRLVVPVGPDDDEQDLVRLVKKPDHDVQEWHVMPVRFAPMPGGPRI